MTNRSRNQIIEIIGLPASGKTTLAHYLSRQLGFRYFDIDLYLSNPFLPLVAKDPKRYAFVTGLRFSHVRSLRINPLKLLVKKKSVILDQGFDVGFYMYTKNHFLGTKIMTKEEYDFLEKLHLQFMKNTPPIMTTIVLDYPIPVLIERITKRGRQHEKSYSPTLMNQWNDRFMDYNRNLIKNKRRKSVIKYTHPNKIISWGKTDKKIEILLNEYNRKPTKK